MPAFNLPRAFSAVFVAALLLVQGCTPTPSRGFTDVNLTLAEKTWDIFVNSSLDKRDAAGPFNSVLSMRYQTPDDGFRLSAYIWSNSEAAGPYPLRLDLQSSMGSSVAKILEAQNRFLLYDLHDKKAYRDTSSRQALFNLGLPMPFSLGDLSLLISGRYLEFFFPAGDGVMPPVNAGTTFNESVFACPHGPRKGELTIDAEGRPTLWAEAADQGWTLELSYLEGNALPGPYKLAISHPAGYSATILVKSFDKVSPFTPEQLDLTIPESIPVQNL